ncbi:GNAT family N-acetyltransferase [Paenibacillus validus]|uniref:GNAT family N-acetyltransferase n=1 Tax=Paenibacillus validus TaxID=44253 RepID=A0A7X2ZDG5_9BACL|nr:MULTISPECIES: GNAT family N-acetyltransferase [Paenibacillus]MED4600312.1 GNAT family N-acetyltransferase [Paenibacillus validus]MED4606589.1 GNAT family N-acetyltransferase [Paenibacillus validus]MUG72121.1 GNAT family N-acetyltransferase [Paenibacillus validus]
MIDPIDLNDMPQVLQLLELQQIAYRIEAELVGFEEIPPLFDSPQSLRDSQESFFGYFEEGRLVGAVACRQSAKELTICRMMVHPDFFRRGIAGALLRHIESFAVPGGIMTVSTGTNNTPAVNLYEKHGFEPVHVQLLAPGITMTKFMKRVDS